MNNPAIQVPAWSPPFEVGEVMVSRLDFAEDSVGEFAARVQDFNPLHHDAAAAARSRFGGLIASGAHTVALMMGTVAGHVAPRCASLGLDCAFRLRRGVPVGTVASVEWTVTAIAAKPSLNGYTMSLEGVLRDGDQVFITGTMLIVVMPREALIPEA